MVEAEGLWVRCLTSQAGDSIAFSRGSTRACWDFVCNGGKGAPCARGFGGKAVKANGTAIVMSANYIWYGMTLGCRSP